MILILNDDAIGFLNQLISDGAINASNIDLDWLQAQRCVLDEKGIVMTVEDWLDENEDLE